MKPLLSYYRFSIPLLTPFTTSFGTETNRTGYILRLEKDGFTSYSECVTAEGPYYSYEDNETAMHIIRTFLAAMIADMPEPAEFLQRASVIKGHNMAKAALEMLLWDYHSRLSGERLADRMGENRGYADVGISIGMDSAEKMVQRVSDSVGKGYRRIKVKIKRGREVEILSPIRDAFPEISLSVDANTDYTMRDLEMLKKLDRFNLTYIEQPLAHDDLIDHSRLAKEIATPICLDESITDSSKASQAFEIGACTVINIKPGRVAGLTESLKIADVCSSANGHCWVGGMLETGIGRAFNVSMASMKNVDYPGDTSPNGRYFARDVVNNPFHMTSGRIEVNGGPGTGVEVDEAFLAGISSDHGLIPTGS